LITFEKWNKELYETNIEEAQTRRVKGYIRRPIKDRDRSIMGILQPKCAKGINW
jgi:hypothetical protein